MHLRPWPTGWRSVPEATPVVGDSQGPVDLEVDARHLNCPLPILRTKKALSQLQSGQVLKVMATDPGSKRDFEAFARQTGNALQHSVQHGEVWTFWLKRR
jgi:tRNA 2-thiouridine synthesizing protein A